MDVYADTSFLFSYYLPDANSPKARNFMLTFGAPLPLTVLHRLRIVVNCLGEVMTVHTAPKKVAGSTTRCSPPV